MADSSTGDYTVFNPGQATGPAMATNTLNQASQPVPGDPSNPQVFLRWHYNDGTHPESTPRGFGRREIGKKPVYTTLNDLLTGFETQEPKQFRRWRNLLAAAGYVEDEGADYLSTRAGYLEMLEDVYALQGAGQKIGPKEYLKSIAQLNGYDPDDADSENFTGSKTFVERGVADITEGEAWAEIQGTLQRMLGRDPSEQETRDFTYRMNHLAASNPTISTTVAQWKNGELTGDRSTSTKKGFTAADMEKEAYDQAQADPDYAEYTAASSLFNAALSALGPIGG